jgi:acetyl-CoA carboxylase carboxyl transferase subunit beta
MSVEDGLAVDAGDGMRAGAALTEAADAANRSVANGAAHHAQARSSPTLDTSGPATSSTPDVAAGQSSAGAAPMASDAPALACKRCGADVSTSSTWERFRVCKACGYHAQISARRRLELLLDGNSFREAYPALTSVDPLLFSDRVPYSERLAEARERTGLEEAVVIGTGRINARDCVLAVFDFEFMGGSMGTVVGEKIALAMDMAVDRRLPFVSIAASGGARMQEGMLSLVQMAKTSAAAMRLHRDGIPYISVLTDPTTGGVYASFASHGDVLLAEPGALIGFAGPRVIEQITGRARPKDAQSAEYLLQNGQIDAIVDRTRLRNALATLLQLLENPWNLSARGETEPYRPEVRPPASA